MYFGSEVSLDVTRTNFLSRTPNRNKDIIVHGVRSYLKYNKQKSGSAMPPLPRAAVASQYNIAAALGEDALYAYFINPVQNTSSEYNGRSNTVVSLRKQLIERQEALGKKGSRLLQLVSDEGVLKTIFAATARNLPQQFVLFTPTDSALAEPIT